MAAYGLPESSQKDIGKNHVNERSYFRISGPNSSLGGQEEPAGLEGGNGRKRMRNSSGPSVSRGQLGSSPHTVCNIK